MQAIFLDIETTGLNAQIHHPLDIAFKVIDMASGQICASYQSLLRLTPAQWLVRDPASMQINGYSWEETLLGKESHQVADEIQDVLNRVPIQRGKTVFLCQNPAFDRAFFNQLVDVYVQERLKWPYHWLDLASMFWAFRHFQCKNQGISFPEEINVSKNAIARHFGLPQEIPPHRAMQGVDHLIQCYEKVFQTSLQSPQNQV